MGKKLVSNNFVFFQIPTCGRYSEAAALRQAMELASQAERVQVEKDHALTVGLSLPGGVRLVAWTIELSY
jgi:hypothetical protein